MHEDLQKAIASILRAANENGKRAGIYATSGEQARKFADQGFHMVSVVFAEMMHTSRLYSEQISVAADMSALTTYLDTALSTAKGSYAHSAWNIAKGAAGGVSKVTYGK